MMQKSRGSKKSAEQELLLGNCQEQCFNPVPTLLRSSFILQKSEAIYKFRLVNKSNIIQNGGMTIFHSLYLQEENSHYWQYSMVYTLYLFKSFLKPGHVLCNKSSLLKNN